MILKIIGIVILVYFCIVFVIPLLIFPGFIRKRRIRGSEKTEKIAGKLRSKDKEKTLRNVFNYVKKMYTEERYNIYLKLKTHFYTRVDKIVDKKQFLPCHVQNLVLITLLVATGQFKRKDLKKKIVILPHLTVHEYYLIKVNKKLFKVDLFFSEIERAKLTC